MKRWLMILLFAMLVAGCKEDAGESSVEDTVVDQDVAGEDGDGKTGEENADGASDEQGGDGDGASGQQADGDADASEVAADVPGNTAARNASLREVLMQIIKRYGFAYDLAQFNDPDVYTGLLHTQLIDFDADGQDELYVLFKAMEFLGDGYEHRETDYYVHEVWRGKEEGEAKLSFYGVIATDFCESCGTEVVLTEEKDGTVNLREVSALYSDDGAEASFIANIYEMVGDEMAYNAYQQTHKDGQESEYVISDEIVNQATFDEKMASFAGQEQVIIKSEMGMMDFGFSTVSSAAKAGEVLRKLSPPSATTGEEVDGYLVQAEAEYMTDLDEVNIYDERSYPHMLSQLVNMRLRQSDMKAEIVDEMYLGYPFDVVNDLHKRTFGIPIDLEKVKKNEPEDHERALVQYKEGLFLAEMTEFYKPYVVRKIERAYEFGERLYYLELNDTEVDELAMGQKLFDQVESTYRNEPVENWPEEIRRHIVSEIKRYAVMRVDNGEVQFHYLSYQPLSNEELAQFE